MFSNALVGVLLLLPAYLYAFWAAYVLVMALYRAHLGGRLRGLNRLLALPVVLVGLVMDVLANWLIAPLVFADLPREALVTTRLQRYMRLGAGWRFELARSICDGMLDPFDPTGNHC